MIKFIGHAGFLVKSKNYQLLVDPWLAGSAFDLGWDLVSESKIDESELSTTTHIWYSHEHPDHFSINCLRNIYKINSKIKIIFHYTKDKRVINFCKNIGFEVVEVKNFHKYFFDEKSYIQIIKCGLIDSFSIIKNDERIILNMNDAIPNIQQVHDYIKNFNTLPVILYPGDEFNYHNNDNLNSIKKYQEDYRNIKVINKSKIFTVDELMNLSSKQILKIKKYNNAILVFFIFIIGKYLHKGIKPIKFLVKDLGIVFSYNIFYGLKNLEGEGYGDKINLVITSDVLASILKNDWGIGTTLINGRFWIKNLKFLDHFRFSFTLPLLNSHGIYAFNFILNKLFKKKSIIEDIQFTLLSE